MNTTEDGDLVSIRCPGNRPHNEIHDVCGHLIGAIIEDKIVLYCDNCKQFYILTIVENGHVILEPIDKATRLRFKNKLRVVE